MEVLALRVRALDPEFVATGEAGAMSESVLSV
jgi:hypothetical protein